MTAAISFLFGIGVGWATSQYRIAKRKAQADELRFLLAPVIPHSVEDAARRAGC